MSLTIREYQQPHFTRLLTSLITHNFAHDGSDTGTGKTYVGAALLKALDEDSLVIAPKSVIPDWEEALAGFGARNVTVMNYEKAWRRLGEVKKWGQGSYFKWTKSYKTTIFDESHRCGGERTISAKMMIAAKKQHERILSLSATIAESPIRLRAFGFAIGWHNLENWHEFLMRCQCKPGTFGGWTFSAKAHPEILRGLQEEIYGKGLGSRMIRSEIPGFPKTVVSVRMLGNPDSQLLKMGEELRKYFNERIISASKLEERGEQLLKVHLEAGKSEEEFRWSGELARIMLLRQALETAKAPIIVDMIEDALETSRVAVFCNFNKTINDLVDSAKKKKWKYGIIRGEQEGEKDDDRTLTIKAFKRNELDVIFCNTEAGGVGVSLHDPFTQVPRTAIICPTFSGRALKQVIGRVHRAEGGFSRQFLIYFEDSYEGHIARMVQRKLNALDMINDAELSGDFRNAA